MPESSGTDPRSGQLVEILPALPGTLAEPTRAMWELVQSAGLVSHQSLVFIAARSGEGTSYVARQFASAIARLSNDRVLLVDAAAPPRGVSAHFRHAGRLGLVDAVIKGRTLAEAVQRVGDTTLYVARLQVGPPGVPGSRVIEDEAFWTGLKEAFKAVIVDAPAIDRSVDGLTIASRVEGTILVVEAERTRAPVVINLKHLLLRNRANILGAVLNRRRFYIPTWIYRRL